MDRHTPQAAPPDPNRRPDSVNFQSPRSWEHYRQQARPLSFHPWERPPAEAAKSAPNSAALAEEQSGSDVSDTPGRDGITKRRRGPKSLAEVGKRPPPESVSAIRHYLDAIEEAAGANEAQWEELVAKRRRKDERKRQRRELEDRRLQALTEARNRNDAQVSARRSREDEAFKSAYKELDEEENAMRLRLKRLKRGAAFGDSPDFEGNRSLGSSSSPTFPPRSSALHPAKRHQTGPPAPPDAVYAAHHQPQPVSDASPTVPPSTGPQSHPGYHFYPSNPLNPPSYSVPYHHSYSWGGATPTMAPTMPPASSNGPAQSSTVTPGPPPPPPSSLQREVSSPKLNGHTTSSASTPLSQSLAVQTASPANALSRSVGKEYNTRPPDPRPPITSGFASINVPPNPGFSAINPRGPTTAAVLPGQPAHLLTETSDFPGTPDGDGSTDPLHQHHADATPGPSSAGVGKRTPSTTHPYSQSEAFANRHHHSERVDSLNRGIWTSYGPGGTLENPRGPPLEMYLRCNHDDCRRIDWRTVHGLQCHIVKQHEQPKGTIGSLEKALDRYGVPVSDVEEYERENGVGSAGTMADPKNQKIKNKTREMQQQQRTSTGALSAAVPVKTSTAMSLSASPPPPPPPQHTTNIPGVRSIGYKPGAMPLGSPMFPNLLHRKPIDNPLQGGTVRTDGTAGERSDGEEKLPRPIERFGAVRGPWHDYQPQQQTPSRVSLPADREVKKPHQNEDHEMYDATPPASAARSTPQQIIRSMIMEAVPIKASDFPLASMRKSPPVPSSTAMFLDEPSKSELGPPATETTIVHPEPSLTAVRSVEAQLEKLENLAEKDDDKTAIAPPQQQIQIPLQAHAEPKSPVELQKHDETPIRTDIQSQTPSRPPSHPPRQLTPPETNLEHEHAHELVESAKEDQLQDGEMQDHSHVQDGDVLIKQDEALRESEAAVRQNDLQTRDAETETETKQDQVLHMQTQTQLQDGDADDGDSITVASVRDGERDKERERELRERPNTRRQANGRFRKGR